MNGLYAAAATVCASSVAVALLSRFITDGGTKKLLGLVTGAFLLCSLLLPLQSAFQGAAVELPQLSGDVGSATADEALQQEVLVQTKESLEQTALDLAAQHGFRVKKAQITLAVRGENHVILTDVTLIIGREEAARAAELAALTEENFSVTPQIITEQL